MTDTTNASKEPEPTNASKEPEPIRVRMSEAEYNTKGAACPIEGCSGQVSGGTARGARPNKGLGPQSHWNNCTGPDHHPVFVHHPENYLPGETIPK